MAHFAEFLVLLMSVISCQAVIVPASPFIGQEQTAPEPVDLQMQLRSVTGSNRFQIGELIPLEVLLSSSTSGRYLEPCALFNESAFGYPQCRFLTTWTFVITPKEGWVQDWNDPLMMLHSGPMYEVPSHDLGSQVVKFSYALTNRFRFDKPGEYHVRLSIQVGLDDETTKRTRGRDVKIQPHAVSVAREIVLEIVPAAPEWEQEIIRKGYQAYSGTLPRQTNPPSPEMLQYQQATQALCNLGTPDAARMFARLLSQGRDVQSCLWKSPNAAAAIGEMQHLLVDPDAPVPWQFFDELVTLLNDAASGRHQIVHSQQIVDNERDTLFRALPQKRGEAQISSLMTVLQNPSRSKSTPFESSYPVLFTPEVIASAVTNFDRLPSAFQEQLMGDAWERVRSPLMLPVVRRRAATGDGPALLRWLELDPAVATAFIREEVVRPAPRFSSFYLRLPDASLPDQESQMAANFIALSDERALIRSATLLHRYATRAVLPEVLPYIDAHISKWSCWLQFPVLAYLLKVSPEDATSRVKLALEKANSGGCVQWAFFSYLGVLQPSPVLERLAVAQIDEGTKFASDAGDYLRQYGSGAIKPELWNRLVLWNKSVPSAASKQTRDQRANDEDLRRQIVRVLAQTFVEGHAWVLSPEDASRLEKLLGTEAMGQLVCKFNCVASPAVGPAAGSYAIYGRANDVFGRPMDYLYSVERLRYALNQYNCPDLKSLKEKLLQFPAGSSFHFASDFSGRDHDELVEISDFLWSHGYKVRNPENWTFLRPDSP